PHQHLHPFPTRRSSDLAETVPAIPPTTSTTRPDFIYPFELTQSEFTQVMNTESYIIAEGLVDYENGFDSRIKQPFCYAYVWGGQDRKSTRLNSSHVAIS